MKSSPTRSRSIPLKFLRAATVLVAGAVVLQAVPSLRAAGSIFDDDYIPPKRAEMQPAPLPVKPVPAETVTPTPPAVPVKPGPAVVAPAVTPPAPQVTLAVHHAVPDRASRTTCRKLFEEVFTAELKDRTPASRKKLAQRLLDEALKSPEGSADRFVLLTGAMQAAEDAFNLRLSFAAAEQLARSYEADELAAKVDAATKVFGGVQSPLIGSVYNVDAVFRVADQLAAQGDFADVSRLEAALQHGVGSIADAELKSAATAQIRDMAAMAASREKAMPAFEQLKKTPDDPAANLAAGSYLCFQRGKWDMGLPMLAKSNDATLKALAARELARPADPNAVTVVADDWWDIANTVSPLDRPTVLTHATTLYRAVEGNLTGLRKMAIAKRAAEVPSPTRPHRVDLLEVFDPTRGMVDGAWRIEDVALVSEQSAHAEHSRVDFEYVPPAEFDFRISFTRLRGEEAIGQICYAGGHQFVYQLAGWRNTITAFETVKGVPGNENATARPKKRWLTNGQRYTSVIKVRKSGVEAYLDGALITGMKTDYSDMSLFGYWQLSRNDAIGIAANNNMIRFDTIEVIEITGEGKLLSP